MAKRKPKVETNLFVMTGTEDEFDPTGWNGLPEYNSKDNDPWGTLKVDIRNVSDLHKFADLVGDKNLKNETKSSTKSMWFPALELGEMGSNIKLVWMDESEIAHLGLKEYE